MKSINIKGHYRTEIGTKFATLLRKEGNVPCVIYGGEQPIHFYADAPAFRHLVYTSELKKAEIQFEDKTVNCIVQDIQFHPVTDEILHIDLIQLMPGKPVVVEVPIVLTGSSRGVRAGGKLKLVMRKIKVKSTEDNMPSSIEHDITQLKVGQSARVSDLNTDGIEVVTPANSVICIVKTSRNVVADTDDDEEAA